MIMPTRKKTTTAAAATIMTAVEQGGWKLANAAEKCMAALAATASVVSLRGEHMVQLAAVAPIKTAGKGCAAVHDSSYSVASAISPKNSGDDWDAKDAMHNLATAGKVVGAVTGFIP